MTNEPQRTSAGRGGLPTSRAQFFSPTRSASGRFFMVSAAKASERVTELEMRSEGRTEPTEGHARCRLV